jgi:hypothetical protein
MIINGKLSQVLHQALNWPQQFDLVIVCGLGFYNINHTRGPKEDMIPWLFESLQEFIKMIRSDFNAPVIWSEPWQTSPSRSWCRNPTISSTKRKYFDEFVNGKIPQMPPWLLYAKIAPKMTPADFLDEEKCAMWKFGAATRYAHNVANLLSFIYEENHDTRLDQKLLSCFT